MLIAVMQRALASYQESPRLLGSVWAPAETPPSKLVLGSVWDQNFDGFLGPNRSPDFNQIWTRDVEPADLDVVQRIFPGTPPSVSCCGSKCLPIYGETAGGKLMRLLG